jgi:hypothetical protein
MKPVHLLGVEGPADRFAELFAAAAELGLRVGWLDLESQPEVPAALATPARAGALRAVALSRSGTLAAKRLSGRPRLADLLREHFLGCRLVLIRGDASSLAGSHADAGSGSIARLSGGPSTWVVAAGEARLELSSGELARRLRSPAGTLPGSS